MEYLSDHKGYPKHEIYVLSNWCYYDSLDGAELRDGEELELTWPDGHVERQKILVKKRSVEVSDMGHPWTTPITEAFIVVPYHGFDALLQLSLVQGLRVKRV